MTHRQKSEKFKELLWNTNIARGYSGPDRLRWKNKEQFADYVEDIGGRVKADMRKRRGYLVLLIREEACGRPQIVAEFPIEFVDRALALGFLP